MSTGPEYIYPPEPKPPKKIYLACPYSHNSPKVRRERFKEVSKVAGTLISQGYIVFSPISMTHPIATHCSLPLAFPYWEQLDKEFIRWCDIVMICKLDGYKESTGVNAEIKYAKSINKKIHYILNGKYTKV